MAIGEVDQTVGFVEGGDEGFLEQHRGSAFESMCRVVEVSRRGSRHDHHIGPGRQLRVRHDASTDLVSELMGRFVRS